MQRLTSYFSMFTYFFLFMIILIAIHPGYGNSSWIPQLNQFKEERFHLYSNQFKYYHKIYNNVDTNNNGNVDRNTHIDGLLRILEYGFAKVSDFISKDETMGTDDSKDEAFDQIQLLYETAKNLDNKKKLSTSNFLKINLFLANIVDTYKIPTALLDHIDSGTIDETGVPTKALAGQLGRYIKIFENMVQKNQSINDLNLPNIPLTPFVAVIYKGKSGISVETFVKQQFAMDNYNLGIAVFDLESVPYNLTEDAKVNHYGQITDPHYSKFNTTLNMLTHDLSHIIEQSQYEEGVLYDKYKVDLSENLKKIAKIREKLESNLDPEAKKERYLFQDYSDYLIITNGLFILSHELFNVQASGLIIKGISKVTKIPLPTIQSREGQKKVCFLDIVRFVKEKMKLNVLIMAPPYNTYPYTNDEAVSAINDPYFRNAIETIYKQDYRDHEFILQGITIPGVSSFYPNLHAYDPLTTTRERTDDTEIEASAEHKKRTIEGFEEFWDYFIELIKRHGFCDNCQTNCN